MSLNLSTAEVARILGTREARVREWVRAGLCRPSRHGRRYVFSFQDLVVLRAAQGLRAQNVPAARVRQALAGLIEDLGADRPLSGVRVFADGRQVAVRAEGAAWQPATGQQLLDFDVEALAERAAEIRSGPSEPQTEAEAGHHFERALGLEDEDPVAACEAYSRALELDPELVDAYVNLGRLAHAGGDSKEAARLYHQALERSPTDPVIHFNLALALEDAAGPAEAVSHYERALTLDPAFADAHYNLAGLCEKLGRATDALRHYGEYRKLTRP